MRPKRLPVVLVPALLTFSLILAACAPIESTAPPGETPGGTADATLGAANTAVMPAPTEGGSVATSAAPAADGQPERIEFAPGATSAEVAGSLPAEGVAHYILSAQGGQFMNAVVVSSQGEASLSVYGADGTVLISPMGSAHGFSGELPTTQDYHIDVRAEGGPAEYTLTVTIPPASGPTEAPAESTPTAQRIQFPAGGTSATRSGNLPANGIARYVLGVNGGQTLNVTTTGNPGPVAVSVFGADGTVLQSSMGGLPTFSGTVPTTQDYYVDVSAGSAATGYSVTFSAPP
jgi:hypothetical protein